MFQTLNNSNFPHWKVFLNLKTNIGNMSLNTGIHGIDINTTVSTCLEFGSLMSGRARQYSACQNVIWGAWDYFITYCNPNNRKQVFRRYNNHTMYLPSCPDESDLLWYIRTSQAFSAMGYYGRRPLSIAFAIPYSQNRIS